ncbi:BAM_G0000880.mRNA.1.CDS.1 [Saccharomyces cerevisiae]|nr:BAM_G0000880.mRNA.1.CDS.1 [Saccharomyces cerevisiae]CAI7035520.1 BAM_G0000880.mRNA.1.CDS.1 [Saccharomyces cerevisiae]
MNWSVSPTAKTWKLVIKRDQAMTSSDPCLPTVFNASVKLLKESEVQDQKVWLSFTHDTDILNYLTTIGIIDDKIT